MNRTFDYFNKICKIPRESGNEEPMRKFLLKWAKDNNINAVRDKSGNIIMYCPATPGYEKKPTVILQGHMDMVCVKRPESKHDFLKDPIETVTEGDWISAKDTSLGADDGIAVAAIMSLFTDSDSKHGNLEAVITYSEETSMEGAQNLDASLIQGRKLINLDSEKLGEICIGCAGGIEINAKCGVEFEIVPAAWETVKLEIAGLKGGHSGEEINKGRLNAISAMGRLLTAAGKTEVPFMISKLEGGTKKNVIPSNCECIISFPEESKKKIMQTIIAEAEKIKNENSIEEPGFIFEKHCTKCEPPVKRAEKALSSDISLIFAKLLFITPHGVFSFSKALSGIVETSDNLAIVRLNEREMNVIISIRSSVASAKDSMVDRISTLYEAFGFNCVTELAYPGWNPNPSSELTKACVSAWEELTGETPKLIAIHAGLECGVISNKVPEGIDCVSFGPDMHDIHSFKERVSISSTNKMYEYVVRILERI